MYPEKHTQEPWWDESGVIHAKDGSHPARCDNEENSRRIVACVNACIGIPTEILEDESSDVGMVARAISKGWDSYLNGLYGRIQELEIEVRRLYEKYPVEEIGED